MKHYLKMCQTVEEQGGVNYFDFSDAMMSAKTGDSSTGWQISEVLSEMFYGNVGLCQPFVFSVSVDVPLSPDLSDVEALRGQVEKLEPLAAPFKVFSIEMIEGSVTVPRPQDTPKVYTECLMVVEAKSDANAPRYFVFALSRNESAKDPRNKYFVSVEAAFDTSDLAATGNGSIAIKLGTGETLMPNSTYMGVIKHFLDRLTNEAAGGERVNERIRVGKGSSRRLVQIKKLIHITPKKHKSHYTTQTSRTIEWSHRWFSRGHWRKIADGTLGKDRDGNYCEVGRTWVIESVKGPSNKDIINKVRMVKDGTR